MENELTVKEVIPGIYLMDEMHHATGYFVIGEEKVLVIDTMNGFTDIMSVIRGITDKPVVVVNTHGHGDHTFGNVYFDEAYINPKDLELAEEMCAIPEFVEACSKHGMSMPPFKAINEGDIIDLGGRTLEVFELPGHTPGSIVLLLREDRVLFTGDAINHHLWLQLDGCLPLPECVKALDRLMFLEDRADYILHGHARDKDDISLMRCMRNGIEEICDGKTAEDKPYKWFDGEDMQHAFSLVEGKQYSTEDSVICYRK